MWVWYRLYFRLLLLQEKHHHQLLLRLLVIVWSRGWDSSLCWSLFMAAARSCICFGTYARLSWCRNKATKNVIFRWVSRSILFQGSFNVGLWIITYWLRVMILANTQKLIVISVGSLASLSLNGNWWSTLRRNVLGCRCRRCLILVLCFDRGLRALM